MVAQKKPGAFNGQKGWHRVYLFCRILFLRCERTRLCIFSEPGTFGDTLCIKILDRKFCAIPGNRAACAGSKYIEITSEYRFMVIENVENSTEAFIQRGGRTARRRAREECTSKSLLARIYEWQAQECPKWLILSLINM
ncbi:hypothetical protein EVAR_3085_1 [Eumeta japonica]|uniref:Uncharacterized protein n=1 Tax=Eumeta variegata TaxID=151549 RepID=A0A4C1SX66_EUMVA|nr:hypothetical protein EVAR_3085_1 [Eumeta japonica]